MRESKQANQSQCMELGTESLFLLGWNKYSHEYVFVLPLA